MLGILLSRLASGAISDQLGWRAVFWIGAGAVAILAAFTALRLPGFPPTTTAGYGRLLRSLATLIRDYQPLRRAALSQALLSTAFGAFWSTLAMELADRTIISVVPSPGMFKLRGRGWCARSRRSLVRSRIAAARSQSSLVGAGLVAAAFAGMGLVQGSLVVLVVGAIVFDLGTQAALISHQTIIYGLDPTARSRLNAVLISSMFVGWRSEPAAADYAFRRDRVERARCVRWPRSPRSPHCAPCAQRRITFRRRSP